MPAIERSWTRAEVLDLIARNPLPTPRYELVDGELLVTPAPGGTHQSAVGLMHWHLRNYLVARPEVGEVFMSPADVKLEPESTVGPDVFVVTQTEGMRFRRDNRVHALVLAVEVLSPGDRSGDRTRKRALYQRNVREYWIVDTTKRAIEVWRPGMASAFVARERLEWNPAGASQPFVLDVAVYFANVFGEPA
ncbi:MAG TPA: Uma2 family endonuclease [Gemmatimonadaceae bacterium]|nr:Uma2 family endonuclease [Gemmatimonadaceae bacterium]